MATGECLTFIQAVAVHVAAPPWNKHALQAHTLVMRNSSLRVDGVDRKALLNLTLGPRTIVTASGTGRATEQPQRVDHETLTDCHVLPTAGQRVPLAKTNRSQLAAKRPVGGVWQDCTRNEWTLSTPAMIMNIGVVGPFETGYLNEGVSDRTFNLDVKNLKDPDALQGIINGDKNGLFVLDPELNPEPAALVNPDVGALVPLGPHGNVQEVTAANVKPEDVLFPAAAMAKMDAVCGTQQSLRAFRMREGGAPSNEQARGWKQWKSRSPPDVRRWKKSVKTRKP